MKKAKAFFKKIITEHGTAIAGFAFAFVYIAANSSCFVPYYEPEEPKGLDSFKKFNK